MLSRSSLSFQDIYVNGSVGDGELWTDTWGRDLHHHPLFLRQGQGLEQGKFICFIQGGSDKFGIFFFFLLNGTTQLKTSRFLLK
jgi:hypothetical protein